MQEKNRIKSNASKVKKTIKENAIARLAVLVKELIGDRSIRQTSTDTGIAASYISGILKEKHLPSADILRKLVAPEASPKNGVTLEDLMIAAGYQSDYLEETIKEVLFVDPYTDKGKEINKASENNVYDSSDRISAYHDKIRQHKRESSKFETVGTGIIYKAMAEKRIFFSATAEIGAGIRGYRPDMVMYVSMDPILEWWIDFKHVGPTSHFNIRNILSRFMFIDPKMERKISLVLDDEHAFQMVIEYKDHLSYRGDLSVILIDLDTFTIVDEKYLAHYERYGTKSEFKLI